MVAVVHFLSYACCLCCRPSPFPRTQTQAQAQEIVAASTVEGLDSERGLVGLEPLPYELHDLQDALRVYIASHSSSGSNKQEASHTQPLPQPETDVQARAICDASERIENVYIYEDVEAGHVYYPLPLPLSKKRESNVSSHGILESKENDANQINDGKVTGSYARSREANMLMQQCGKVAEGVGDGADQCSSSPPVLTALDNFEHDLYSHDDAVDSVDFPGRENSIGIDARKEEEVVEEEMASRHCELKDSDYFEEKESLSYFVKGLDTADNKKRKLEISKNSEITAVWRNFTTIWL